MAKKGLTGINGVTRNLNLKIKALEAKGLAGMIMAAALVRRDMDITPPVIPVDTGNLRASWSVSSGMTKEGPWVLMGFSAGYALWVHERDWKLGKRPGSGPKFFESAIKRNKDKMLKMIAGTMRA